METSSTTIVSVETVKENRNLLRRLRRRRSRSPGSQSTAEFSSAELSCHSEDDAFLNRRKGCLKIKDQAGSVAATYGQEATHKTVSWNAVEVHFHGVRLGDNPACSRGPPVCIEWNAFESLALDLEEYEETKPETRSKHQMLLPAMVREDWLRNAGYSRGEIKEQLKEVLKIKESRHRSSSDGKLKEKLKGLGRIFLVKRTAAAPETGEVDETHID